MIVVAVDNDPKFKFEVFKAQLKLGSDVVVEPPCWLKLAELDSPPPVLPSDEAPESSL